MTAVVAVHPTVCRACRLVAAHVTTATHTVGVRALGGLVAVVAVPGLGAVTARVSGLDPDPDQARSWVEQELAKDDYRDRRSLLQQLLDWLQRRLGDLQNPQSGGGLSFPPFVIAGVAVLVVAVLVVLATRVRRERRVVTTSGKVLGDSTLTAAQLRARADAALREGRYDDAVLDTVRAIAREADARTLLTDAPALTAHEIGRQLSTVFPDHRAAVTRATDRFDAVAYGHLSADRDDADDVIATDGALRRARPVLPHRPRRGGPGSVTSSDETGPAVSGSVTPGASAHDETLRPPGSPVAPGDLIGAGRGSWSTSGGRSGGRREPASGDPGARTRDDDPGSVWTTGGGA